MSDLEAELPTAFGTQLFNLLVFFLSMLRVIWVGDFIYKE
jgi:hypothetical protein